MTAEVGALQIRLDTDLSTLTAKFDTAGRVVDKFGRNTEKRIGALGGTMSKFGNVATSALVGFGAGLVGGALMGALQQLPQIFRSIVAEGAGLVDTANKLGMTTESIQELHFSARQGGASIEDMDKSLQIFVKSLGEASQGSGELLKVLTANGVALRDQAGNIRPVKDLLKDYADLIKRAGSEQERARLTTIAFGRSGSDLANVFRDGAAGIDETASAAHRLGAVIDDKMLQQIADIDDRWDAFATTLATRSKTAILETVTWIDDLAGSIQRVGAQMDAFRKEQAGEQLSPGAMIGDFAGNPKAAAEALAKSRMAAGLAGSPTSWAGRDEWLGVAKETKLPPKPPTSTRDREAERALRESKAINDLIGSLAEENALIGASDADRAVANNLRAAGASATAEQRAEIETLTRSMVANQAAYDAAQASTQALRDISKDVLSGIIGDLREGVSAADALANAFQRIADKLLDGALDFAINAVLGSGKSGSSGGLMQILGLASGGAVTGPGSGRSDSIPAMLSNGEFVINAAATARHRPLIEAINSGSITPFARGGIARLPGFADGGAVRLASMPSLSAQRLPDLSGMLESMAQRAGIHRAEPSGGGPGNLTVKIEGARGNSEIQEMVRTGVQQGLATYDRKILPSRISKIAGRSRRDKT